MRTKIFLGCMSALLIIAIAALGYTADTQQNQVSNTPNIEGTYKLVSRKLPDGTTKSPPDVMGVLTYTNSYRNFNVVWKNDEGKFFSYSLASTYKLTPSEYTETLMFSILNDQIGGKEIKYDLSGQSQNVPVTIEGNRIKIKLPFDPVTVVFEGDKFTAEGADFVDFWEKVK